MTDIAALIGQKHLRRSPQGIDDYVVAPEQFSATADRLVRSGMRLALFFGTDDRTTDGGFGIHAILADDIAHTWVMLSAALTAESPHYPSLTRSIMAAHWYERYTRDMFGIEPSGHPDLRRLVHHENVPLGTHPLRKDFAWNTKMAHADVPFPMHHVEGDGVYEVPVGPIHAGIIEPGHFRFCVVGERVITLEGKLFFTHKGIEKLLEGKDSTQALPLINGVSGDMSASHALAFCQAAEAATGTQVPLRARQLRTILSELERITMHIHDCANILGNGIGYTIAAAQGFRIKEEMVRLSARLLKNRFWRGLVVPGGVMRDLTSSEERDILATVSAACADIDDLLEMAFASDGVRERLETTGILDRKAAIAYGAVGIPARASGIACDVRSDHPYAAYPECALPVVTQTAGDVFARLQVRKDELRASEKIIRHLLASSRGSDAVCSSCQPTDGVGLGAVESWRGEILTWVRFAEGRIDRCVVRDPSFCNWALFGELTPGNIIPDFPLCNKSLNLSYSGADL